MAARAMSHEGKSISETRATRDGDAEATYKVRDAWTQRSMADERPAGTKHTSNEQSCDVHRFKLNKVDGGGMIEG